MENNKGLEREISIKEIFWNLLFGWRKMVCFAVLFGVLLGGVRYGRDMAGYHAASEPEQSEQVNLTNEERIEIDNIKKLRNQLERDQKYLSSSPYMQMDPYNMHLFEAQYYIKSDYVMNYTKDVQTDYTPALGVMYYRYISSGAMRDSLIENAKLVVSSEELAEMVDVSQSGNVFSVAIKYPDEDILPDIADAFKGLLSQKEKQFQKIGGHSLVLMGESQSVTMDNSAIEKRNAIFTRMASINVQINQLKSALSAQQKNTLNAELNTEEKETIKPQPSKKYFILGAVVGIFLAAIWIVCKVLFTARLQKPEEIRSLFGVRLLGEVNTQYKKKRFLSGIDDRLLLLKNRKRKRLNLEQQVNMICTNIAISCRQQEIDCIYMTGSEFENVDPGIVEMLEKKLKAQDIRVEKGENIYYDAESMKQGKENGNILLVEQTGLSVYDEISNEIQLLSEQDMNLMGVVVFV